MESSAPILFDLIDQQLRFGADSMLRRIFSTTRDLPWTPQQRATLRVLIERELDRLIRGILKMLDNVGAQLPEEAPGWSIIDVTTHTDIRVRHVDGGDEDYEAMWLDYLCNKGRLAPPVDPVLPQAQCRPDGKRRMRPD